MTWPTVKLGDVVAIKGGGTPDKSNPSYWGGSIPWASVKDFKSVEISKTVDSITVEGLRNSASNMVPAGSVLVPTRMAVGKVAINKIDMAINQDLKALTPIGLLDTRYLLHCLNYLGPNLEKQAVGATVKGITLPILRALEFPLPPLDEQRRIAAILDQADALRRQRRATLERLHDLGHAIFADIIGDPVINSKNWDSDLVLGDAADIASGITKGRKVNGETTHTVPYLAVVNVQDKSLNLDNVKTIDATESEIRRYRLIKDDLLLTEGGDPDKLGRGTLWNDEIDECIHQNHIFRVRITSNRLSPIFLNWLVGSARGKAYFLKSAKQTTGIASINMTQLRAFPLLVPPMDVQQKFADAMTENYKMTVQLQKHLAHLYTLFSSLQQRAFRGEL